MSVLYNKVRFFDAVLQVSRNFMTADRSDCLRDLGICCRWLLLRTMEGVSDTEICTKSNQKQWESDIPPG